MAGILSCNWNTGPPYTEHHILFICSAKDVYYSKLGDRYFLAAQNSLLVVAQVIGVSLRYREFRTQVIFVYTFSVLKVCVSMCVCARVYMCVCMWVCVKYWICQGNFFLCSVIDLCI